MGGFFTPFFFWLLWWYWSQFIVSYICLSENVIFLHHTFAGNISYWISLTKAVFMNKMQVCEASFAINKSMTISCWWCMLSSELPAWIRTKDVSCLVSCLQQWPPPDGVKERNYTVMPFFSRNFLVLNSWFLSASTLPCGCEFHVLIMFCGEKVISYLSQICLFKNCDCICTKSTVRWRVIHFHSVFKHHGRF